MLNETEQPLVEAIDTMLQHDVKLGLKIHDKDLSSKGELERGYEYLHGQIDEMFQLKANELEHHNSVTQAFFKVHNYKYLDDPTFVEALEKEMTGTGVPAAERDKARGFIPKIIDELKKEQADWAEKDFGFHPNMDEIHETSQPEQPLDFDIHDRDGYNDSNVTWEDGDASPGHMGK